MVFSSEIFLFFYLPVVLVVYYLLPKKYRNVWLIFVSLFFYAYGAGNVVFILTTSIILNWLGGGVTCQIQI